MTLYELKKACISFNNSHAGANDAQFIRYLKEMQAKK